MNTRSKFISSSTHFSTMFSLLAHFQHLTTPIKKKIKSQMINSISSQTARNRVSEDKYYKTPKHDVLQKIGIGHINQEVSFSCYCINLIFLLNICLKQHMIYSILYRTRWRGFRKIMVINRRKMKLNWDKINTKICICILKFQRGVMFCCVRIQILK